MPQPDGKVAAGCELDSFDSPTRELEVRLER